MGTPDYAVEMGELVPEVVGMDGFFATHGAKFETDFCTASETERLASFFVREHLRRRAIGGERVIWPQIMAWLARARENCARPCH